MAVLTATYSFNNKSNDAFFFKASAIDKAQRQVRPPIYLLYKSSGVKYTKSNITLPILPYLFSLSQIVKGIKYILKIEISRTMCKKREANADLAKCDFQPKDDALQQVKRVFCLKMCWKSRGKSVKILNTVLIIMAYTT